VDAAVLARELKELVAALDRRVPHVERAGEVTIAREASALRAKAVARLAELLPGESLTTPAGRAAIAGRKAAVETTGRRRGRR
jgi:hypothetical protein